MFSRVQGEGEPHTAVFDLHDTLSLTPALSRWEGEAFAGLGEIGSWSQLKGLTS